MPGLLRQDGSPPLFYFLLHFWTRWFGTTEGATHLLPLVISLAAVPAGYWAGRELFDRPAGLAAAGLMATNPFLNWYSTETRMYTLVILLATVAVTLAGRAVRDRRAIDAVGAVAVYALLLYTHDWAIYFTAATTIVIVGVAWLRGDRPLVIWGALGGAAAFALWLPWVPSFLYQAGNTAAPWAVRPGIGDFFADPSSVLAGTLGVLFVPLMAAGVWACRRLVPSSHRWAVGSVAAFAFVTTLLGFIGAEIEPSWTERYLAIIVAPYLVATAGMLAGHPRGRRFLWVGCSALVAWALTGILLPNPNHRYAKDNLAAVAGAAMPHLQVGDVVVVTQTEQVPVAYHYLPPGLRYLTPTGPVGDPSVVDWRNIVHRLRVSVPCAVLGPTLDSLPVGTDVLEISPVRRLGATGSAWSRAVNAQVVGVEQFLEDDPSLLELGVFTDGLRPKPYAPVDGILYQKISARPDCA
jgi:mannosyltransferase